jgi:hypothetical protein
VYATGAAALASSLASKPAARKELMAKVNEPVPPAEQSAAQAELASIVKKTDEGTVTPAEGRQGVELAMRLGKPRVAAEISAKAPPLEVDAMSSLPDNPLPPIAGIWNLFKETLKALTFTTLDPLANYREGLAARSKDSATSSGSFVGWSPFDLFKSKKSLSLLAMLSAPVSASAAVANLVKSQKKGAPLSPSAKASLAPPASPAKGEGLKGGSLKPPASTAGADDPCEVVRKKMWGRPYPIIVDKNSTRDALARGEKIMGEPFEAFLSRSSREGKVKVSSAGARLFFLKAPPWHVVDDKAPSASSAGVDDPRSLFQKAVGEKKMSRDDFNRAVELHCGPGADAARKKEFGARMLDYLAAKKVVVSGESAPTGNVVVFKGLVAKSLEDKKMSRDDFNKAVAANLKSTSTKDEKTLAAAQLLRFLEKRGVKVT